MARHRVLIYVRETVNAPDRPIHRMIRAIRGATVAELLSVATATAPTFYTTEIGGTEVTAPFITDENGLVIHEDDDDGELWLSEPADLVGEAQKRGRVFPINYPGISAQDASGRQVFRSTSDDDFVTLAAHTAFQDVGVSGVVPAGLKPVIVAYGHSVIYHSVVFPVAMQLLVVGGLTLDVKQVKAPGTGVSNPIGGFNLEGYLDPDPDNDRTVKVQVKSVGSNNPITILAAAASGATPMFLRGVTC